jgi:nicotinamide-nucleotide amidase
MAQALNEAGILVKRRISVGDNADDIIQALNEASEQSSIILITGGLGPTADDITKPVLCQYFGGDMVVNEGALENVQSIFRRLKRPMIERNLKQAEVPSSCTVIQNKRGTAPGMWFEKNGRVFVSMPGVPHEMKGMMTDHVLPALQTHFQTPHIVHRTLLTAGVGESFLADMIQHWEEQLPPHMNLAYLPNYGMVRLRIDGIGSHAASLAAEVDLQFEQLKALLKDHLVTDRDEPMEIVVGKLLKKAGKTMGTAESCTGGYIAHLITSHTGSSDYFTGSVVSYDNKVKEALLGVMPETLEAHGAVSEAVVRQMASGALASLGTDYVIAVSGIMGPGGGSDEKPVGTVWVAAGSNRQVIVQQMQFRFDRRRNIELTATNALNLLRKLILSES